MYLLYSTQYTRPSSTKRRIKVTQTIQSLNYGIHTKNYAVKEFYATQSLEGTQSPNSSHNNKPSMVPKKSLSSSHTTHYKMTHPLWYPKNHNHAQSHPSHHKINHPLWYLKHRQDAPSCPLHHEMTYPLWY
jgi:hypothetical protein